MAKTPKPVSPASEALQPRPKANTSSVTRNGKILIAGLVALTACVAIAGLLYLNRQRPLVELKIGAGPRHSDAHELMQEVAEVVARQSATLRLKIVATQDSSRNISLLNESKLDLATIRSDTPVLADIRLVAELFSDYFQLLTRLDPAILSVNDLVGKRVAIPPFGTDEFRSFWTIGDHYDLPPASVNWMAKPFKQAAAELIAGKIDAVFTVRSLRDRQLLDMFEDAKLKRLPIRMVEIDQADAIAIKRPFLQAAIIPKGAYGGETATPARDIGTSSVGRVLVAREDVAADAIAELTRILFEYRLDLTTRFALASAIRQPVAGQGLSLPIHQGAASFYNRDKPGFIAENTEMIGLVLTIAAMLGSALIALRSRLGTKQKNRMDSYNYILLDIGEKARAALSPKEVAMLKQQMFGQLERVVQALDTDEVTEEGFQSFSLLWESVKDVLNDRNIELREQQAQPRLAKANRQASDRRLTSTVAR